MKIEFGYGCGSQTLCVPDENVLGVLQQNELALPEKTARELVAEAIAHPIGCPPLREIVHRGEKIAIVTSDITRPLPSYEILPELLRALFACGVEAADVTVVFAIGSHRRHTPEEMRQLAGDYAFETVRCVDSDPDDCVRRWISRAPLRRPTGGSASEMWNFTGSRATAAAPRPSCRASPPVRPSPATTA